MKKKQKSAAEGGKARPGSALHMVRKFMPLKTGQDCQSWLERAQNEAEPTSASVALMKGRVATINAFKGILKLGMDYRKLIGWKGPIPDMEQFMGTPFKPVGPAGPEQGQLPPPQPA